MKRLTTPPRGIRTEQVRPHPASATAPFSNGGRSTLGQALQAVPQRELATMLAYLVDSLPVPALLSDCSEQLRVVYANAAWRQWAGLWERPCEGKPLASIFGTLAENPFLPALWRACDTGEPAHFRDFEFVEQTPSGLSLTGDVRRWDWDAFPLAGPGGPPAHLLILVRDVTDAVGSRIVRGPSYTHHEDLTSRERDVAVLIACGLRNPAIASQLGIGRATVASHVTRILQKLGFTTRTQIAAWVAQQGMSAQRVDPAS